MSENFRGKAESLLSELGRKIDQLIEESKDASEEVREEIEDRISEIRKNKAHLEEELHNFAKKNEPKWKAVEERLGKAVDEVKEAIKIAFSKK